MARTKRAVRVADRRFFSRHFPIALAALTQFVPAWAARNEAPWPQVPVPQQVEIFDIGQETVVNGIPIRMRGFVSRTSPAALAASFRQALGKPLMEDQRGNTFVLGRGEGRYYMTVQLVPVGSGTRGVIAISKPPVADEDSLDTISARRLLSGLPPGSTLANHTSSVDGKTHAEHDAIVNMHSIGINSEYVQRMLRADGFILERESRAPQTTHTRPYLAGDARTMFFKRPGAEAIAVLFSDDNGRSVIVLNRITRGNTQ
jgi:hypothetical protein